MTNKLTILIFFLVLPTFLFGQADAGEDKAYCNGEAIEIGTPGNSTDCYRWQPTNGLDDPNSPMPMANPSSTTTYTLTVTKENFTSRTTDDVTVKVNEAKVELEVEEMLTECMEDRILTYTATAEGFNVDDGEPIKFTFHYERSDGSKWESEQWSLDLTVDDTVMASKVLDGDSDHKFTTPIFVIAEKDDCMATSATLDITVYELWIEYVQHNAANPWKAIVGKQFNYSAIASADCKNWDWDMKDGAPQQWNPAGGNAKSGKMTIPNGDLPRTNTPFGDTFGTVSVFCEDGEGNKHSFESTNMNPPQKVKVFYDATASTNPVSNDLNWFVYYKSNYGNNAIIFGCDSNGRSFSSAGGGDGSVRVCNETYAGDMYITTTTMAGQLTATGWSAITRHYANFVGVVDHERQHANNEIVSGPPLDVDGDFLPSAFETSTSNTNPNQKYSARGVLVGVSWDDGEVYAGGPIEQRGITRADTSQDWAQPGTNWP